MDSNLHEWLHLLIRMAHFVSGIMWIGTSFYFVWLDSAFRPPEKPEKGVEGELRMVHGGFFYRVEKRRFGAGEVPKDLHWFKWEATLTWITGFLLLWVVYYLSNGAYLIDPSVRALTQTQAVLTGLGAIFGGWFVYDLLFRSPLARTPVINLIALGLVGELIYFLTHTFSGRGAFIHLGAVFGTIMVLNVWVHILPSQRAIIRAAEEGREPDFELGKKAKRRSMHNSYMTLPVLFTMISNHFGGLTGHAENWIVLILVVVAGAMVRHFMITLKKWALIPALAAIFAMFQMTRPAPALTAETSGSKVAFSEVWSVITQRCLSCHATQTTDDIFKIAPNGIIFDTPERLKLLIPKIYERVVVQKTMPFLNKTQITDAERDLLARWIAQGAVVEK